jgi:hypothetical protein
MKVVYTENEKRHIFESETGHMSTFLKERVTKEQAETLFLAQLANEGITASAAEKPIISEPEIPVAPAEELVMEDIVTTEEND